MTVIYTVTLQEWHEWYKSYQIFPKMPVSAGAITGLVDKIITALGPQILEPLLLGPAPGPTLGLEVSQDRLLEGLEAGRVHVGRHAAVLVGADHPDGLAAPEVLLGDEDVLGIAAVVVEATFGKAAGPGAVGAVELEPDLVLSERRSRQVVVVGVSPVRTHLFSRLS